MIDRDDFAEACSRSFSAFLTCDDILIIAENDLGWDIVLQGPHPMKAHLPFDSADNAKERGYEIGRNHLIQSGVRRVLAFKLLNWEEQNERRKKIPAR